MKFVVVLLGFISLWGAGEAGLLGAKECTYGPGYWCGSLRNAKQCDAVTHCIQTVWEKQHLPEDNDDVCSICKDMVKQARDQLLSNETQEEIREVFEGSCKLIPVAVIRAECLDLSDQFIPELIQTLASKMDPLAVCSTAGLCNSERVDRLIESDHKSVEDPRPGDCKDCKTFLTDVIQIVKQHSRSELLDHLMAICGRLSSLSDGCMALVESNMQAIYDFLTNELKPLETCELFGMCAGLFGETTIAMPKTGDEPCDFCVAVVNSWRKNFFSNTTKDEFKMILKGICHQTGSFEQECNALVDQYFEFVYEIILSEIEPKGICEAVGLCGRNSVFAKNVPVWSMMEMRPQNFLPLISNDISDKLIDQDDVNSNKLIGQDEANSYKHNLILPRVHLVKTKPLDRRIIGQDEANSYKHFPRVALTKSSSVSVVSYGEKGVLSPELGDPSTECVMCEFTLHFLQNVLSDHKTREEVEAEVEKVCSLLPHSLKEQCQDYIEAYGDQVIQMIVLEIDPSTICPMLKLCPGGRVKVDKWSDTSCVMCEYAMTQLDEILKDKSNEEAIREAVEKVCSLLPHSVSSQCKTFVDNYIDEVVDLIVNGFTPKEVCVQLGLCHDSVVVSYGEKGVLSPELGDPSTECVMCEFTLHFLQNVLSDHKTREEVEAEVEKVCSLLPHSLKEQCQDYIEAYGDQVIQMIVLEIDPSTICPMLKLCPGGRVKVDKWSDTSCVMCEYAMTKLDQMLNDKSNEKAIREAVEKVCSLLPHSVSSQCKTFVDNYIDEVVDLIVNGFTPKEVCVQLGLCHDTVSTKFVDRKQSTVCVICEFVISKLDNLIADNYTVEEIEKAVDHVCFLLPTTLMNDCLRFVEDYGDSLVELLVSNMDPRFLCMQLHLCRPNVFALGLPKAQVQFQPSSVEKCLVCEETVEWVAKNIDGQAVTNQVERILEGVCAYLPGHSKQTCTTMVLTYGEYLRALLDELKNAKSVCQALKMCPYHGPTPLLGAHKCTRGPGYWCQSRMHAEACKATQHCVDNVWGDKKITA